MSLILGLLITAPPPTAAPASVGMNASRLGAIDRIVAEGLRRGNMPGAVVLVGRRGKIVYRKAFGFRQLVPEKKPMTTDTLFDLASLTKPVATATCIMKLVEQEKLSLDDRVSKHIAAFGRQGKDTITIRHLLLHTGGLIADNALADYRQGRQMAFQKIDALKPIAKPGERFVYSDVGFIVLGRIVEKVSGQSLDRFAGQVIFKPAGMKATGFNPPTKLASRAATTQQRGGKWLRGNVHDPRAHFLGGVAGHAGLFSTADDLARYAQMLLNGGTIVRARILQRKTISTMTKSARVPRGSRTLGWDHRSPYSINRGDLMSESAFGHGGFTGTALWIDPENELFVIFLSNRVHPNGKGSVNRLIGRICTVAVAAVIPGSK